MAYFWGIFFLQIWGVGVVRIIFKVVDTLFAFVCRLFLLVWHCTSAFSVFDRSVMLAELGKKGLRHAIHMATYSGQPVSDMC